MTIAVVMFLFVIAISAPGPAIVGPETQYEMGLRSERPPHCQPATTAALWAKGKHPQGKAATYSLRGQYECETEIFRYGERPSFQDYVARHANSRIRQSVTRIGYEFSSVDSWVVRIHAEDQKLASYLENAFQVELARVVGRSRVARYADLQGGATEVAVRVNRVTDPDLFLEIFVIYRDKEGMRTWRAY